MPSSCVPSEKILAVRSFSCKKVMLKFFSHTFHHMLLSVSTNNIGGFYLHNKIVFIALNFLIEILECSNYSSTIECHNWNLMEVTMSKNDNVNYPHLPVQSYFYQDTTLKVTTHQNMMTTHVSQIQKLLIRGNYLSKHYDCSCISKVKKVSHGRRTDSFSCTKI
jgi:hypothetical protein